MGSPRIKGSSSLVVLAIAIWGHALIAREIPRPQSASTISAAIASPLGSPSCQVTVLPYDHSNSQNARAPSTRFRFARAVYLIKADEIAASGFQPGNLLSSIGWTYGAPPGITGSAPLIIYMENTADTTNTKSTDWVTAISTMTVVHNAITMVPGVVGEFTIPFTGGSPFTYTGGGLYVAFDWGEYTGTLSTTTSVRCNGFGLPSGILGAFGDTSAPTTLGPSDFRPETRLPSSVQNDVAVGPVYSYGELPLGLVPAQTVQALLTNRGTNSSTNLPTTVQVSGANAFTNMQTIPNLTSCGSQVSAIFAGFTPAALGTNTVSVSVPGDDVPANNNFTYPLDITPLSYSYKIPGSTASGGTGFLGNVGALVGRFTTNVPNAVTVVKLEFTAASATHYRVAIFNDAGDGTPSSMPLYEDVADRTVTAAGPVNITLPSPGVAVGPGNFFVGIEQRNNTLANLSYDLEQPVRVGSFFTGTSPPPSVWHDFSPLTIYKLNIGVVLQTPAPTPSSVVSRKVHGGAGPFDVNLPLSGDPGIECRSGGGSNDYQIVFTFPSVVTFDNAAVTAGTGSVNVISGAGTTNPTLNVTGVANAQTIAVTLFHVTGGGSDNGDVSVQMRVLVGDTSGNGSVNASDVSQTKAQSGSAISNGNFREDVNANGVLNASDVAFVKSRSGTALPP